MIYEVIITIDAETDLDNILNYLLFDKRNSQAASDVLKDFEVIVNRLSYIAGSIALCSNEKLKKHGYRRIGLNHHRYFLLYRIEDNKVFIDKVFHELQDYENKIK